MKHNKINEQLIRKESKKKMDRLYKEIKKAGGDIGEKVAKSQQRKETNMPNAYYINNPFDGKRHIDTFESFCLKESRYYKSPSLEDMYSNVNGMGIDETDYRWIKGSKEDNLRPMFNNHPDEEDKSLDILRVGKFIELDGVVGQIHSIKNKKLIVDIINKDNKHEMKEYDLIKVLKKLKYKDNE